MKTITDLCTGYTCVGLFNNCSVSTSIANGLAKGLCLSGARLSCAAGGAGESTGALPSAVAQLMAL